MSRKLADKVMWYDSYYNHSRWFKNVLKEIPLKIDDKVIEVGCGSGWLSRKISKIVTKGEVVGTDISEYAIEKTKRVTEKDKSSDYKNLSFKVADVENISYPNNYFDCAISIYSFSFWSNPEKGLREIRRILKTNRKLCIFDVYDEMPIGYIIGTKFFNLFSPFKENLYSTEEYREFFEKAGFVDVHQKRVLGVLLTVGTKTT